MVATATRKEKQKLSGAGGEGKQTWWLRVEGAGVAWPRLA